MTIDTRIAVAIITGSLSIIGGFLINFYIRKKEDKTKRLQIKLEYLNKQIEELYGPLYSYIQQIFNYWDVQQELISPNDINNQDRDRIIIFFREKYFYPLHNQIRDLLKNKFNLIEGNKLPESFRKYLQHSTLETTQITLWNELNIDTQHTNGIPWPNEFENDVKKTLDVLMKRYDTLLKNI
jgi:hypothetical protein